MGLNFRKSINLGKGLRLNLGKKSASVSVGKKGVRHSISTTGRQTTTVSVPGTGLSYSHTSGTKKAAAAKQNKKLGKEQEKLEKEKAKLEQEKLELERQRAELENSAAEKNNSSNNTAAASGNPYSSGKAKKSY